MQNRNILSSSKTVRPRRILRLLPLKLKSLLTRSIIGMPFSRSFNVIGVHAEGEVGDVVTGGVLDPPGGPFKTMHEKMRAFEKHCDQVRQLLLQEPRGRASMCANVVLPPVNPDADIGLLILESDEYVPMSGSNTICTVTAVLETGMVKMIEPVTQIKLDTAAGLVTVQAECENGKCKNVAFDNIPCFVFKLGHEVDVPGLGTIKADIAWGGMMFALVDIDSVPGLSIESRNGARLVKIGEDIKKAVQRSIHPVHPENPGIHGVTNFQWMGRVTQEMDSESGAGKTAVNTVVVSPGRLDRSPCGTGTCARLAVMHARGQIAVGESFRHVSVTGTQFESHIRATTKVGEYDAVLPTVKGRAWITSFKQVVLDASDPFPMGFRVGDSWHVPED